MSVSQYFTGMGIWGVLFFVIGSIVNAIALVSVLSTSAAYVSSPSMATLIVLAISGFAVLLSVPMMLIGRAYDVTIIHIPKSKIS